MKKNIKMIEPYESLKCYRTMGTVHHVISKNDSVVEDDRVGILVYNIAFFAVFILIAAFLAIIVFRGL